MTQFCHNASLIVIFISSSAISSPVQQKVIGKTNYQNTKLFIHENAYEDIVCEMAAFLSRGRRFEWYFAIQRVWCWRWCRWWGGWRHDAKGGGGWGDNLPDQYQTRFCVWLLCIINYSILSLWQTQPAYVDTILKQLSVVCISKLVVFK